MAKIIEKRIASRHLTKGPITLNSSILTSSDIDARLLNFSDQGICFTTNRKLIPGTTILFRTSNECHLNQEVYADSLLRSTGIVTVKWCHENSGDDKSLFTVGATYLLGY